ncbi:transcription factor [Agrobacterium rubi]|uniref:Transcription factor n=1 Tax=Agrobacterium rubi TaxID=28099 RepID=A0AAE7UQ47_9HYPH|nr:transcription factor [Agrobacterium rubi]NTE89182.1 transcription factor [Agrobacterium rubi]NTF04964.1 transcription factor [Agrobacterium rubi]NTF38734.1 transcription factor [Agrobacterium rubi]OCJ43224.1 transcription factor [Agrobacterium rubi]QTF99936.1 transcription factor [Agrobacterium rubi]
MSPNEALSEIKRAIENSPRNGYVAELHLQVIKYADALDNVSGKEFCETLGIGASFGTEYSKMRKIAPRLREAGLDVSRI